MEALSDRLASEHVINTCHDGWIEAVESDGVRPCGYCRPGRYALWKAGYDRDRAAGHRWTEARRREVYEAGFREIGLEPPEPRKGRRSAA